MESEMSKLTPEAVKAALEAATPGPWKIGIDSDVYAEGECDTWITLGPQNYDAVALVVNEHIKGDAEVGLNARLIAMAPTLATAYLALTAERDEAKASHAITQQREVDANRSAFTYLRRAQAAEAERDALADKLAKAVEASIDIAASLAAAISLLERGGKKAAASDRMFAQMLLDYNASLDRFRTTLAELKGDTP